MLSYLYVLHHVELLPSNTLQSLSLTWRLKSKLCVTGYAHSRRRPNSEAARPPQIRQVHPDTTRLLLLANSGQDGNRQACRGMLWFSPYTCAGTNPWPANSMLSNVLMNLGAHHGSAECVVKKTWVVGNALVTIRVLTRIGWVEVVARHATQLLSSSSLCSVSAGIYATSLLARAVQHLQQEWSASHHRRGAEWVR